jgi:hypothetical protein
VLCGHAPTVSTFPLSALRAGPLGPRSLRRRVPAALTLALASLRE